MNRRALGVVAILLIGLMALVATAGLDNLPPSIKKSVDAGSALLSGDKQAFESAQSYIDGALKDEPTLFQNKASDWQSRLQHDRGQLDAAAVKLASVQQLAKANRRTDEYYVETGLGDFNSLRQGALRDSAAIRAEVERWLASKRTLPARIQAMQASFQALQSAGSEDSIQSVRKAMSDWPAKRDDLQKRLDDIAELKATGEKTWDSSAQLRSSAESNQLADSDIETLLSDADQLDAAARQARENTAALTDMAAQLYVGWDKLLLDVDHGSDPRQKVRVVRTRYPDATLANPETTSEERWEPLSESTAETGDNAGMVIERKSAGEYDSQAERAVQPPAYAYIAPPGQSNQYGSWSQGVWHWLPAYLILSQLLHASRAPISTPDFDAYQDARRYGGIFYGRNRDSYYPRRPFGESWGSGNTYTRPPPPTRPSTSPSTGGWYTERPRSSGGPQGYAGSRFQSRGTFSGSQYQSRGTYRSSGGMRSYSGSRGGRR